MITTPLDEFFKPFGQSSVYDPMVIPYNYKYNGKELQETGMYDYGERMYIQDVARWEVIDGKEKNILPPPLVPISALYRVSLKQ